MVKKINIYLTNEQRKMLDQKMSWYKVSLSTIVDKICNIFNKELGKEKIKLWTEYIHKPKGNKTCCKPKYFENLRIKINGKDKTDMFCTNATKIWLLKELKTLDINEKRQQRIYSLIDNELRNTIDKFWNYNETIRNTRRMIKDDPEYWQKVVEENKK